MEKTVYLPKYTISQLENGSASVWAQPIPVSTRPSKNYSLAYTYDPKNVEDNEGIDPVEKGKFFPSRAEPDMVLERLVEVSLKKRNPISKKEKIRA